MSGGYGGGPAGGSRSYTRTAYSNKDSERLQEQCQEKQKAIEDSTTESLRLVQETLNIGAATAAELEGQGKQIDNIHGNLVEINADVKKSEHHVRGIKSVFGAFLNRVVGPPKEKVEPPKVVVAEVPVTNASRGSGGKGKVQPSSTAPAERHHLDTDRTHDNLQQIGFGVGALKEMALSMGGELDRQNKKLGEVNTEADKANMGVNKITKDMNKILAKA